MTDKKRLRVGWIVGIAALLAVIGMIVGLVLWARGGSAGKIEVKSDVRRGSQATFAYTGNDKLKQGDVVRWYVDNRCVETYPYAGSAELHYTPTKSGSAVVKVVAGKYRASTIVEVQKPVLTLVARDITVTYGEEIPEPQFYCTGLLENDTLESLQCDFRCKREENCKNAGTSQITFDEVACESYEVHYQNGTLTILPKELQISDVLEKTYDQTNLLQCENLNLAGVLEGDQVQATADCLYFDSKNVGEQNVVTANIQLTGKDAANYRLASQLRGRILPKRISVEGVKAADKYYDGTTRATVENPGKLKGVLEGDNVAIGTLEVAFDSAAVGDHGITVKELGLVGLDKDNYVVVEITTAKAKINSNNR